MDKIKITLSIIIVAGAFYAGRQSATIPTEVRKVEETKKENSQTDQTVVTIKRPDGTIETTKKTHKTVEKDIKKETKAEVPKPSLVKPPTTKVSLMAGVDLQTAGRPIVYGAEVSMQVLGPISLGVFGLSNGIIGISGGMAF